MMTLPQIKVKATADTSDAETKLKGLGNTVDAVSAKTGKATTRATKMSGAMGKLGKVSASSKGKIQQVSYQLQDIAVQMQMGTRTSVVLAQQLPQLAGAFGAVGAAVGVLAAVGIPTVAFAMSNLGVGTVTLEDQLKQLDETMAGMKGTQDLLDLSLRDLSIRYGENAFAVNQLRSSLAQLQLAQTTEQLRSMATVLGDTFDSYMKIANVRGGAPNAVRVLASDFGIAKEGAEDLLEVIRAFDRATTFEEQKAALSAMEALFDELGISASDLPPEIRNALVQMKQFELAEINAKSAAESLAKGMEKVTAKTGEAANKARDLSNAILDAISNQNRLDHLGKQVGGGRGTDPREWMNGEANAERDRFVYTPTQTPRTRSGGGASGTASRMASERAAEIEALIESLQTEREILEEWRAESMETLATASEEELAAIGGQNEAKLRLEEEYQERLAQIKDMGNQATLENVLKGGADVLGAMGSFNKKALKISQVFAAGEALISTYKGAAKELEKGTFGFARAAAVIAKGMAFVGAIKGVNASTGASSGAASAAGGSSVPEVSSSRLVTLDLGSNAVLNSLAGQLIPALNEEIANGGNIRFEVA